MNPKEFLMKNKDKAAFFKFWGHDLRTGQAILAFGKESRKTALKFKSAKIEIQKLKNSGK
jgi:hypothetical protein